MDIVGIALCVISAAGFSLWPLLVRYSGASQGWAGLMILLPAATVNLVVARQSIGELPDKRMLMFLGMAGALDVIALLAFTTMLSGKYSFSGLMTANIMIQVVITSLGGVIILGEPLTRDKVLGYILGAMTA